MVPRALQILFFCFVCSMPISEQSLFGKNSSPLYQKLLSAGGLTKTEIDSAGWFEKIASIVHDQSIICDELRAEMSNIIPKEPPGLFEFTVAARVMLTMLLANGVKINKSNVEIYKKAVFGELRERNAEALVTAISDYYRENINRANFPLRYKHYMKVVGNPFQALKLALEENENSKNHPTYTTPKTQFLRSGHRKSGIQKFGCSFEDEAFTFRKSNLGGPAGKIEQLDFNQVANFKRFEQLLLEACHSLKEEYRFNDVDQLIRFFSEYKLHPSKISTDLEDFYRKYKYPFRPLEDTAVFELKFLEELERRANSPGDVKFDVKKHFYFISTFRTSRSLSQDNVETDSDFCGHVAGAFKVDVYKRGKGYIIIDLNIGVFQPIVVLGGEVRPKTVMAGTNLIEFKLFDAKRSPIVIAEVFADDTRSSLVSSHVYYAEKISCNFLENTYKPNLVLGSVHGMFTLTKNATSGSNKKAYKRAQIEFNLAPVDYGSHGSREILISKSTSTGGPEDEGLQVVKSIPFIDLIGMRQDQSTIFNDVAKDLGMSKDLLVGKMLAVNLLLIDDNDLLHQRVYWSKEGVIRVELDK